MLWKIAVVSLVTYLTAAEAMCPNYCVCAHQTIDCSSRQLQALPQDLPNEVTSRGVVGLPFLTDTDLSFTTLNLANNQLDELPTALLSDRLPHLQRLDLSFNNVNEITRIQSIVLSKELLHLKLSNNPIRNLGFNSDNVLFSPSISHLDISYCAITSITNSVCFMYMMNLTHLDLSGNPLIVVDHLSSTSLTHLDLSHCLLGDKSIRDESFLELPNLKFLNISMNSQFTKFPSSKQLSSSLNRLDASFCAIEKLDLRSLPNLQSASLKGNIIKVLHEHMLLKNPKLKYVDLSENSVHVIEENAFAACNSLEKINLSLNLVSNLDLNVFSQCILLHSLNISSNLLSSLDEIPIPSLMTLDASKCDIFKISPKFIAKAENLKYLNLSYNSIETLPKIISSRNLVHLDLSYCRISDLQYETFQELPSLSSLNLAGNRLTMPIKGRLLEKLVTLKQVNLGNNPWHCDCNDPDLRKHWKHPSFYRVKTEYFNSLICHSPTQYAGMSLEKNCFENYTSNTHVASRSGAVFSFLIPFLTLCCLLAIVIVIRQAYNNHSIEVQEQETTSSRRRQSPPRVPAHHFDDDLERGIQMSVNESTQQSPIRELSKLPSYEEALLLPKPQSREDLQRIVTNYEEHGMFERSVLGNLQLPEQFQLTDDSAEQPSTSGQY